MKTIFILLLGLGGLLPITCGETTTTTKKEKKLMNSSVDSAAIIQLISYS